jgi:hypothetical protein
LSQAKGQQAASSAALDYEFFKTKVQPVFLAKRLALASNLRALRGT